MVRPMRPGNVVPGLYSLIAILSSTPDSFGSRSHQRKFITLPYGREFQSRAAGAQSKHDLPIPLHAHDGDAIVLRLVERLGQRAQPELAVIGRPPAPRRHGGEATRAEAPSRTSRNASWQDRRRNCRTPIAACGRYAGRCSSAFTSRSLKMLSSEQLRRAKPGCRSNRSAVSRWNRSPALVGRRKLPPRTRA